MLGTYQNQIHYERQDAAPQPIKVLSNNGTLFQINGNDIVRIGSNGDQRIVVSNDIVMNQHYITVTVGVIMLTYLCVFSVVGQS